MIPRYNTQTSHPSLEVTIIGVTETHAASEQDVQKEGYHHYAVVRKKASLARSHSGGIAVLVSNSLAPYTTMCDWSNPCCLAIKINATSVSLHQDLYILTVYLPPEHSSYLKSTNADLFLMLANAFSNIPQEAPVVVMGDFNAHTNNQSGAHPDIHPNVLAQFDTECHRTDPPRRISRDHHPVDNYGRLLLQFCRDRDLTILNGCTFGDTQGHYTYEAGSIGSVIDYSLVSQAIWPLVRNLRIAPHDPIMSDHSLLITELDLPSQRPRPRPSDTTPSPLLKFNWTPEAMERLKLRLASPAFQLQIQILEARTRVDDPDIDALVRDFTNLLLEETKQTVQFRKRGAPPTKQKGSKKWYDQSFCTLKQDVHKLNIQARQNPSYQLGQLIREKTKTYKRLLKQKAARFKQMLQGGLMRPLPNPREWWALLRDLRSNAKWEDPDQHASIDNLTNFFRQLYTVRMDDKGEFGPHSEFPGQDFYHSHRPTEAQRDLLNEAPISPTEISMGLKHLAMGKATGLDNISNEMLQLAGPSCRSFFQLLFNKIYSTSSFPSQWK